MRNYNIDNNENGFSMHGKFRETNVYHLKSLNKVCEAFFVKLECQSNLIIYTQFIKQIFGICLDVCTQKLHLLYTRTKIPCVHKMYRNAERQTL